MSEKHKLHSRNPVAFLIPYSPDVVTLVQTSVIERLISNGILHFYCSQITCTLVFFPELMPRELHTVAYVLTAFVVFHHLIKFM